ncbi:MAG TPA: SPOR domain-containing protein, partial [Pseudoxanthomonas sp.]|nr:SPOR domain-containing protein [Pseudoxanthomonas sp.]
TTATTPATPAVPRQAATSAPAAPAAPGVGFAVQLGAFASAAEANALRDRLRGAGYSAIVQPVRTDRGTLNRVRVGPVSSRAEAEQLKARLAGSFGGGMVVSHP